MYVATPFVLSGTVKTIPLNEKYSNLQGMTATLSGWGCTEAECNPRLLSQTSLRIDDEYSNRGMQILEMSMRGESGVCSGDSGGIF